MTESVEPMDVDEFDPSEQIINIEIWSDGKSTFTSVTCSDINCPYNGPNSPILRSNASILLIDKFGNRYTESEQHSGYRGLCPHNVLHRYITKRYG